MHIEKVLYLLANISPWLKVISNIDFSGLPHNQIEKVREVLREEADVFSRDDQYVPRMKIKLKDDIPVQQNCNTIPK